MNEGKIWDWPVRRTRFTGGEIRSLIGSLSSLVTTQVESGGVAFRLRNMNLPPNSGIPPRILNSSHISDVL